MSLIDDALRRVNDPVVKSVDERPGKPAGQPTTQAAPASAAHSWPTTQPAASKPAAASRSMSAAGIGLMIAALCALGSTVLVSRHVASRRQAASASAAAASAAATDVLQAHTQEGLTLSGIVEGGGAPYAVINDAVVSVGDAVAGWTLKEITTGAVRLSAAGGKSLTLHVRR